MDGPKAYRYAAQHSGERQTRTIIIPLPSPSPPIISRMIQHRTHSLTNHTPKFDTNIKWTHCNAVQIFFSFEPVSILRAHEGGLDEFTGAPEGSEHLRCSCASHIVVSLNSFSFMFPQHLPQPVQHTHTHTHTGYLIRGARRTLGLQMEEGGGCVSRRVPCAGRWTPRRERRSRSLEKPGLAKNTVPCLTSLATKKMLSS